MCFQRKSILFLRSYSRGIFSTSSKYILSHLSIVINWLSSMGLKKLLECVLLHHSERDSSLWSSQNKIRLRYVGPSFHSQRKLPKGVFLWYAHITRYIFLKRGGGGKVEKKKIKCQIWSHQLGREVNMSCCYSMPHCNNYFYLFIF